MKKIAVMILAVGALLCASCSSEKGPAAVAKKAVSAIQKGDYESFAKTFDLDEPDQKMLAGLLEEKIGKKIADKGGIASYEIVESNIEEEKSSVKIHFVYKDGSEDEQTMNFKLVDGEWKQVLNK